MGNVFVKYILPVFSIAMLTFGLYHMTKAQAPVAELAPPAAPPRTPYSNTVAGSGIVEPQSESISIGSALSGIVLEVYVPSDKVGTLVKAGEPLFRVDDRQLKAQLAIQKANLAAAEAQLAKLESMPRKEELPPLEEAVAANESQVKKLADQYERSTKLVQSNAISAEENIQRRMSLETAKAELNRAHAELSLVKAGAWAPDKKIAEVAVLTAQAQIQQTETEIERSTVRAPMDSEVLQVNVRPGEFVGTPASKALIVLGDVRSPRVRVDIDENDIPRYQKGVKGVARIRGESKRELPLRFVRIEPFVVPKRALTGDNTERVDTRVLQVIYEFTDEKPPVFVGQQVDVFLEVPSVSEDKSAEFETVSKQAAK